MGLASRFVSGFRAILVLRPLWRNDAYLLCYYLDGKLARDNIVGLPWLRMGRIEPVEQDPKIHVTEQALETS